MKHKKLLEFIYVASSAIGATIVAANIGDLRILGYSVFIVSSIVGGYLTYHSNVSRSVLIVNGMFLAINIFGLIRS